MKGFPADDSPLFQDLHKSHIHEADQVGVLVLFADQMVDFEDIAVVIHIQTFFFTPEFTQNSEEISAFPAVIPAEAGIQYFPKLETRALRFRTGEGFEFPPRPIL
jgi:hypothetical protein